MRNSENEEERSEIEASPPKRMKTKEEEHEEGTASNTDKLADELMRLTSQKFSWRKIAAEALDLDYTIVFPRALANELLKRLEDELEYFTGNLTRIKVYGKWHPIPRQQVRPNSG